MLIRCDRHTHADLRLWEELESADRDHAQTAAFKAKVQKALHTIAEFAAAGRCYCSVSGGKDSAVLAHLLARVNTKVPVRWLATEPLVDPHCRDAIAQLIAVCGFADYRERANHCQHDDRGWHATGTFEAGLRAIREEVGCDRYLLGIRAEESGGRKIRCRRWGTTSDRACAPLAWWTSADVFAYAAAYGIPLHPTYAMLGGGRWPRDKLRVSFLTLRHGEQFGRGEWEREYYGDVLNRLAASPQT